MCKYKKGYLSSYLKCIFRQLFCKHIWKEKEVETRFDMQGSGYKYTEHKCSKCKKTKISLITF